MKLYEITGIAKSGRAGLVQTSDNNLKMTMGAPGSNNVNNPEQLFSAGYASCFSQAMFAVTEQHQLKINEAPIHVTVQLHKDEATGFAIKVGIEAFLEGVDNDKAVQIMKEAHNMCPYSKMVKPENILFVKINNISII